MIPTMIKSGWLNLKRDYVALALTFVLPIVFFSIFAGVFGNMAGGGGMSDVEIAVVDEDGSDSSRRIVEALQNEDSLDVRLGPVDDPGVRYDRDQAEALVRGGDVYVAIIFPEGFGIRGVDDSKQLTAARREALSEEIRTSALACAVVHVESREIDSLNIYRAGLEAMRRAVAGLAPSPDFVLVDGRRIPGLVLPQEAVVKGDSKCHAIAAASILAKTRRDELMARYDDEYPGYDFATHKGYATRAHREAIKRLGPSPIHRRSFTLLPHPKLWD